MGSGRVGLEVGLDGTHVGIPTRGREVDQSESGATKRAAREVWLRHQRRTDSPRADVETAYRRLEYFLEKRYRPRRSGETVRSYLEALSWSKFDRRAREVADLYEQATYGDGVSREEADRAVRLVTEMAREATPLLRRLRR